MYKLTNTTSILRFDGALIPDDVANTDYKAYLKWLSEGNTPLPVDPPTPEQIQADFTARIQQRLDTFAATRGYDGILSACTYAASANAQFSKEGQYCAAARDATWAKGYEVMNAVKAGTRSMPTWAQLVSELPALAWP